MSVYLSVSTSGEKLKKSSFCLLFFFITLRMLKVGQSTSSKSYPFYFAQISYQSNIQRTLFSIQNITGHQLPIQFQILTAMSASDTRRHLATINDTLRAEHNNLKLTKDHLLQHLTHLQQKEKQLHKLKLQLSEQLIASHHIQQQQQKNKAPLCTFLKEELSSLDKQYIESNLRLRNLENEYQACLLDYERIVEAVSVLLEGSSSVEGELSRLKESNVTMRAMIFDCEKLKRVLEQQRRYFKELCGSEAKGHGQRLKQLESIKRNIKAEEDTSTFSIRLSKLHIGLMRLHSYFQTKIHHYRETLLQAEAKEIKILNLGVTTLQNCLTIATIKMKQNTRKMFRGWHNNIFPKAVLREISERALSMNRNSKIRLEILGVMEERLHQNNSGVLQLFEKLKFTLSVANKAYRKDRHYAFNKWRSSCLETKRVSNLFEKVFHKILPAHLKKQYFEKWNRQCNVLKRIQTASILLKEFQNTRETARAFRKWRFEILRNEERAIKQYLRRMREKQMIQKRVNYEKRKVKILTMLHLKVGKIKLRTYFSKYWCNVKQLRGSQIAEHIDIQRERFSALRKLHTHTTTHYQQKDKLLLLKIFQSFVYKCKLVPVYKQWRNDSQHFVRQKRAIFSLVLRRQAKNKIYVMNDFRKCVQYYEKKEMHQVLTDLNKKMEAINQKSTQFRQLLKNCIENLGILASRKINEVTNYTLQYQQKLFFNTYIRQTIRKAYKTFIISNFINVLQLSTQRQMFSSVKLYCQQQRRQGEIDRKVQVYLRQRQRSLIANMFGYVRRLSVGHRRGFAAMINIENVFIFYREAVGFAGIKRKFTVEKYKAMQKELQDKQTSLKDREQNMLNAQNTRAQSQKSLQEFFGKFLSYENRKQEIKARQRTNQLLKKYLLRFKRQAFSQTIKKQGAQNISDIFSNNIQFIFFRNLMVIRYEQLLANIKEELSKINKKRKSFDEKEGKIRAQTQKRLEEETKVYLECKDHFMFYQERYDNLLTYYSKRTAHNEHLYLAKQIFSTWKYEYLSTKRMISSISRIFTRKFLKQPKELLLSELRGRQNREKAQEYIASLLERKSNRILSKAINLWKGNIYKMKLWEIEKRIQGLDDYEESMKQQIKQRRELISFEVPRVNLKKLKCSTFMAFKNIWNLSKSNKGKTRGMIQRLHKRLVLQSMSRWKWLIFYKHTKRAFIHHMRQRRALTNTRDAFNALKNYRLIIYRLVGSSQNLINQIILKKYGQAFGRIKNCAGNEREELNYQRRKALLTLLMGKAAKLQIIKRKMLWKWNSWLIAREHYLPSIMKRCQLNRLKSAFALINEKKYWNDYYIKNIAEEVTSQGYNEVNTVTNSLIRQGYDPDQVKDYLTTRNAKDQLILDKVIKHFKMWSKKEIAVRAFHSWKQYLFLKKNIKRALNRVFNIAGGIGKYWGRWRAKDPHFNEILKKQSRGNMLNRYRQLSRLLKEYHRDIRDNAVNLEELKVINLEYKDKNRMGILMALNSFSGSLKKGLRQGFYIWRDRNSSMKPILMDERYDQIIQGLELLGDQKSELRYRIGVLREENKQLKEKCVWGVECGKILQKLLTEKDTLSIDLADKQHNMKLLLQDNLRLKQKVKLAINNAQKLIKKVGQQQVEQ